MLTGPGAPVLTGSGTPTQTGSGKPMLTGSGTWMPIKIIIIIHVII